MRTGVVYSAVDKMGNKSSVTRLVSIIKPTYIDSIAPVITLIGSAEITIKINVGSWVDPGFTVTDNHDTDLQGKVSVTGGVNVGKIGTYPVYYNVTDAAATRRYRNRVSYT